MVNYRIQTFESPASPPFSLLKKAIFHISKSSNLLASSEVQVLLYTPTYRLPKAFQTRVPLCRFRHNVLENGASDPLHRKPQHLVNLAWQLCVSTVHACVCMGTNCSIWQDANSEALVSQPHLQAKTPAYAPLQSNGRVENKKKRTGKKKKKKGQCSDCLQVHQWHLVFGIWRGFLFQSPQKEE